MIVDINAYIKMYGKDFLKEILGSILINNSLSSVRARDLLLQNKIINKSTKIINVIWFESPTSAYRDDDRLFNTTIRIKNGSNKVLFSMIIRSDETREIMEILNN